MVGLVTIWSPSRLQWCQSKKRWYQLKKVQPGRFPCVGSLLIRGGWPLYSAEKTSVHMFALNSVAIPEWTGRDKPNEGLSLRKSTALLQLPRHLRSEKSNTSSPLISLSGPETAQALSQNLSRSRRAQRFIHQRSQFHRLFILPERPTSEAGPINFSHSCPGACHLTRTGPNTPSFSPFVSRCIVLTSHLSWFFFFNDAAS